MNALKNNHEIVCRYGELDGIELVVVLSKQILLSSFTAMRQRLRQKGNRDGMFFSDVTLRPSTSEISAAINLYVKENQSFVVIDIFRQELEQLTRDKYCIDCSALHRSAVQLKPLGARKSK